MKITILIGDPLSTLPIYATYLRYLSTLPIYATYLRYLSTLPIYATTIYSILRYHYSTLQLITPLLTLRRIYYTIYPSIL
jgi:hypothetical protein